MADDFTPTVSYQFSVSGSGFPSNNEWLVFARSAHASAFLKAHSGPSLGKMAVRIDFGQAQTNSEIAELYQLGTGNVAVVVNERLRDDFVMEFADFILGAVQFKQIMVLDTATEDRYRGEPGLKFIASMEACRIKFDGTQLESSNFLGGLGAAFMTFSEIKSHACVCFQAVINNHNLSEEKCALFVPVSNILNLSPASYSRALYEIESRASSNLYS